MSGPTSCPGLSDAARTFCHTCHHVDAWIGVAALGAEDAAVRACTKADDVLAQHRHQFRGCRDAPRRLACPGTRPAPGTALEAAVLVGLAVIGVRPARGGAGVRDGQPPPPVFGQLASAELQCRDLRGAHHREVHAAVEGPEPRALSGPEGAASLDHRLDQLRAPDGPVVERIVRGLRRGPALGLSGLAERVGAEPFLAHRVAEGAVYHPTPPGEVRGGRRAAVELAR
jgi:hypothetical protein